MFTDGEMICYGKAKYSDRCDIPGRCDGLQSWCLRLPVSCGLCPFFNVVKFGYTRLNVTGWYKDVGVVCILTYPATRGDSIQVAGVNDIRNWPKGGPVDYAGVNLQYGRDVTSIACAFVLKRSS